MSVFEIFVLALVLSADAFAAAVCKGLAINRIKLHHCIITGIWFGSFQSLMPTLGYLCASRLESYISTGAHLIATGLLVMLGTKMLKDAFSGEELCTDEISPKEMFLLAAATSIDAFAAGVSFAMIPHFRYILAAVLIGVTTFTLSCLGVKIGSVFGTKYNKGARIAGGIILILSGLKIYIENL